MQTGGWVLLSLILAAAAPFAAQDGTWAANAYCDNGRVPSIGTSDGIVEIHQTAAQLEWAQLRLRLRMVPSHSETFDNSGPRAGSAP